eukprot:2509335-Pleurochrysis_carterae.AAC.4
MLADVAFARMRVRVWMCAYACACRRVVCTCDPACMCLGPCAEVPCHTAAHAQECVQARARAGASARGEGTDAFMCAAGYAHVNNRIDAKNTAWLREGRRHARRLGDACAACAACGGVSAGAAPMASSKRHARCDEFTSCSSSSSVAEDALSEGCAASNGADGRQRRRGCAAGRAIIWCGIAGATICSLHCGQQFHLRGKLELEMREHAEEILRSTAECAPVASEEFFVRSQIQVKNGFCSLAHARRRCSGAMSQVAYASLKAGGKRMLRGMEKHVVDAKLLSGKADRSL